ncbi:MAG: FtsX-like permease family protein [Bryobacteraceae bacterium]
MIHRLIVENLKHRPVRTLLSAVAIGVQVTMILTLVGVSQGVLADIARNSRGTGADILVRPPGSSVLAFSGDMPQGIVGLVRKEPHVTMVSGTKVQSIGNFDSITGINIDEFSAMSGGFRFLEGGPFTGPDDLLLDEVYAKSHNLHAGDTVELGLQWHVAGIVESGKLSRMFAPLESLQEKYSAREKVSVVYVKVDDPKNMQAVIDSLHAKLEDYKVFSLDEFVSLISVDSIPILKRFTNVVVGLAVIVGFLVVFLSMYTAVLERTREIGILKALGASPGYVMAILMRETLALAAAGAIAGILMSYGTQWIMKVFVPTMPMLIVHSWWPWASLIALAGSMLGAIYPGMKASRQDAIEALAYD